MRKFLLAGAAALALSAAGIGSAVADSDSYAVYPKAYNDGEVRGHISVDGVEVGSSGMINGAAVGASVDVDFDGLSTRRATGTNVVDMDINIGGSTSNQGDVTHGVSIDGELLSDTGRNDE